jgi:MraZ protein
VGEGGIKWGKLLYIYTTDSNFPVMICLYGEYECKIDDKGRINLPSALKKQLPEDSQDKFMMNRGFEPSLSLYPIANWNVINQKIKKLNLFIEKNRNFVRYFYRGATEITLDGSNRLLIPKNLADHAKIGKVAIFLGMIDHIEIWSKEEYEDFLSKEPKEYSKLAEEVMGSQEKSVMPDELS